MICLQGMITRQCGIMEKYYRKTMKRPCCAANRLENITPNRNKKRHTMQSSLDISVPALTVAPARD